MGRGAGVGVVGDVVGGTGHVRVWDVATGVLAHKSGAVRNISRLLVFKLSATGKLADPPPLSKLPLDPPPADAERRAATFAGQVFPKLATYIPE